MSQKRTDSNINRRSLPGTCWSSTGTPFLFLDWTFVLPVIMSNLIEILAKTFDASVSDEL